MLFNKIRLQNSIIFKDASFEFKPGISVVYGLNRSNTKANSNGNGAGKSSLFSQVGEILYETPIIGERQDSVKEGTRALQFMLGKKKIVLQKSASKIKVSIDGTEKKFRTKPLARQWLKKVLPINEEEFNTYVHLDARIPHPLVMGSSTERKRFFNSFFSLDKMDIERKLFVAELAALNKVRAVYSEIREEYEAAKGNRIDKDKLIKLRESIKIKESLVDELNQKNSKLQTIHNLLAFESLAKEQINVLKSLCHGEITEESFNAVVSDTEWALKKNVQELEAALEWEQYKRDNANYSKAWDKLTPDARKLINKLGTKEAKSKCSSARSKLLELKHNRKSLKARLADLEAEQEGLVAEEVEAPDIDRGETLNKLQSLEHQYDHAQEFKSGTCETCGQSVRVKDPEVLKAKIKKLERLLADFDKAEAYKEVRRQRATNKQEIREIKIELENLQPRIEKLSRYADLNEDLSNLPRKPRPFEGKKLEAAVKQRMVDEDKDRLKLLKFLQPNLDMVIAIQKVSDKQRVAAAAAPLLQARINEVHEELSKLRAQLETQKMAYANVKRLATKLKDLKAQLVNEKPLKLLIEAYSDKAMKRLAVQAISNRLVTVINKYARIVFPEDFQFEFRWDTSQLALLVHRKYGKKTKVSDVRKLSGAESKLFTIILVLALLTFVPHKKRSNIIILDEPTANFSIETTQAFKALLPVINQIIPSIVIITPKTDERYEGASEFTVIKSKGVANIVKGHPSEH